MEQNLKSYKGYKVLILIAYLCMMTFGLIENIKGAAIPSIRMEFGVNYTHIGQMLFIASLGYLMATFLGGMATERYGLKKFFILGAGLTIISTALFSVITSFYGVATIYFLIGVAFGCFEVGVNALGGKIFIKNTAMMMNFMHLFYGLGAAIAPKYAGVLLEKNYSWKAVYLFSSVLTGILLLFIIFTKFPEASEAVHKDKLSLREIMGSSKVWIISLVLGLFVMMEMGIANWLVNYLQVARGLDIGSSTFYLTLFFITFTFGRLVGGYVADKLGYIRVLLYFTTVATILLFVGITLGNLYLFLFSVIGFFVSIMFPTMMAMVMKEFPNNVGVVMGFVITVCGIINTIGSWGIGKINDLWGVSVGLGTVGICGTIACILLLVLNTKVVTCRMPRFFGKSSAL